MTRLDAFLKANDIRPVDLTREAGISRQHILRLRNGEMEPRRKTIVAIVLACRRILRRDVQAAELFHLD